MLNHRKVSNDVGDDVGDDVRDDSFHVIQLKLFNKACLTWTFQRTQMLIDTCQVNALQDNSFETRLK